MAYTVDIIVPWCEYPTARCPKRATLEVFNQVNAGLGKFCPRHAEMALLAANARERERYERLPDPLSPWPAPVSADEVNHPERYRPAAPERRCRMTTATEGAPSVTTPTYEPETTLDRLVATFVHYFPGNTEDEIAGAVDRDGVDVHQSLVVLQAQHIVHQAAGAFAGTGRWSPDPEHRSEYDDTAEAAS